jgi:signal peptidase I
MRRRAAASASDDEEDSEDDEEPSGPPRQRKGPHARPSVRPWSPASDGEPDPGEEGAPGGRLGFLHRPRRPVYFRARDSIYFEPLVALAIIVLLLVTLYAYTQNWPPVYVIESDSMQHGQTDNLGLINTGDLVLAQKLQVSQITTYVVGLQTGYTTYGEYGDVLLYYPNGVTGTPVIHRAILFLQYDVSNGLWNATSLAGLTCGTATTDFYTVSSSPSGCGSVGMSGTLTLRGIGWQSVEIEIDLDTLTQTSGFITMGDNNYIPGSPNQGLTDQDAGISSLVEPPWIVGVARGMLPWFGAVKLLLSGSASEVPMQSWEFLGLTLAGIVLVAMGLHYLFRAEGIEDPRRKLEEEEAEDGEADEDEEDEDAPRSGGRRWLHPLRSWRTVDDDEADEDAAPTKGSRSDRGGSGRTWGGRPHPAVGRKPRAKGHQRKPDPDDTSDDGL